MVSGTYSKDAPNQQPAGSAQEDTTQDNTHATFAKPPEFHAYTPYTNAPIAANLTLPTTQPATPDRHLYVRTPA
jgi:hypothetical protein